MQYSENYHMNKPELADQYNLSHWNENTDTIDSAMQNIRSGMDATMKATLLNFCYPIGSIYWSSNSTNPATLFGGTWVQIKDKFVWAKGDSDTVDSTGGAKTVTLTVNNLPSHSHNFTPKGTVSSHSHGMQHYHDRGTMDITGSIRAMLEDSDYDGAFYFSSNMGARATQGNFYGTKKLGFKASKTWTGKTSGSLVNNTNNDTTAKTTTDATQPTFTGTADTTETVGSGTAVDKMPPYVVKYCWERTA